MSIARPKRFIFVPIIRTKGVPAGLVGKCSAGRQKNERYAMLQIWMSAMTLGLAAVGGSALGLAIPKLSHRWNDVVLGFCAGVMLAAAVVGLLQPAIEQSGGRLWMVAAGTALGVVLLSQLDRLTPHLHHITGLDPEQHTAGSALGRVLLFTMAVALHKLPEGLAAGVSFHAPVLSDAWAVTFGLALQNIPEGMVIIAPLRLVGVSPVRTLWIALGIAVFEMVGVWTGFLLGSISAALLPLLLSAAGGAMLYVVSDEMIPETHAHGFQKQATYALVAGFLVMLLSFSA